MDRDATDVSGGGYGLAEALQPVRRENADGMIADLLTLGVRLDVADAVGTQALSARPRRATDAAPW
jgi:hypothetical protein